jgi:signal transduction histidine kinase
LSERFWSALFLSRERGPEVLKWVDFGRRLVLSVALLLLLVGTGLTALSTLQLTRLLEESLLVRGRTVATAAARAAFVPMDLEDRQALAAIAAEFAGHREVAALRITDAAGELWAQGGRGGDRLLSARAPILAVNPGDGFPRVLGRVEVDMDASDIARRRAALVGTSLIVNGGFTAALLSVGLVLIRNLTLRMQIMVDEAKWVGELKRSNRELEEFAYVASHDLQSPLRKVAGFAELLRESLEGRLGSEADEYIGFIVGGTRRMQRLIEDLLTYSRVGSRQLVASRVDLREVVGEVLSDLDAVVAKAGARVEVGKLPTVVADRLQMTQLFQNLLTNALKFRAEAPLVVRVSAERRGDAWLFSVSDNGIGMEKQYLDQIFKMFRRLHVVGAYEGTGIGLAIVRKIVERHGGTVWAESRAGEGATFRFTLGTEAIGAASAPAGGGHA